MPITTRLASLFVVLSLVGCASPRPAPAAPSTARAPERPVYRLDFVLSADDPSGAPSSTSFTLNLEEHEKGEAMVGENVVLGGAATGTGAVRQDVGAKLKTRYRTVGDDLLLEVEMELSTSRASDIAKVHAVTNALAAPGKSSLVAVLDDRHRQYRLAVTPTRLR
jgi:hypothetical protein